MRSPTACSQCRQAKRRCIRDDWSEACESCQQKHLICNKKPQTNPVGQRALVPRSSTPLTPIRDSSQHLEYRTEPRLEVSRGMAVELVEHYLDKFHGRPHIIFHPASLRSMVSAGTLSQALLFAICAIGSKFSANPDTRSQSPGLAAESRRLLQADISRICLENIQACILVAILSVGNGDSASEALFFRIATAMAEIMNLNSPMLGGSLIDREIRRRVWCSLYMTDLWCISGQGLQSHMKNIPIKTGMPINDRTFMSLRSDILSLTGLQEHGIWAQGVTLVQLFGPIHDLNRLVANGEADPTSLDKEVEQLAKCLQDWENKLPIDAQMNQENLGRQQECGLGGVLISTHLAYHHFSTLLYFPFLELQQPINKTHAAYIAQCKTHASAFSSLLRQSRQMKGCDVVYPNVGHMTIVSSTVLIHTLVFGDLHETESVRKGLNANFEALVELSQYWQSTSAMIDRLVVFQDMCLLSTESTAHKVDGWMLRFLIEHSLDIEPKRCEAKPISLNADMRKMSSKSQEFVRQGRYMRFRSPQTFM